MLNHDHATCTMRAPDDHEACTVRDTTGQRNHSHSQNHSFLKPKNPPSQGEEVLANALTLRPYQAQALQNLRSSLAEDYIRILLYSPTGSGKTEMAMAMIKGAIAKGKRVLFLVNRIGLVEQTARRFKKAGIPFGVIQGSNTCRVYENILIASIQTLAPRGIPENIDLVVIDEAHAAAGSKYYRSVIAATKCPVVGLSATPFSRGLGRHYDELGGALFQRLVVAATIPELIADGFLVDYDAYTAPSELDLSDIKQTRNAFGEMDYSDADVGRAVDKPELVGDIVAHYLRLGNDTPAVCFASNIAHSKHIVERFRAAGITAEHLDCYVPEEERQAILKRIETGETRVISNVGILCEGWDFPACQTLILARPTRSLIRYLQMVGRVLRPHKSKTRALILDHSGTVTRLGFPSDDFSLELDDGKPKSASAPAKKEKPLPKACPKCSYIKTVHTCPVCGFVPERQSDVEVKDGELVLLDRNKPKVTKMDKQEFYSQLIGYASTKGYREGWIAHKYREYFGVWPRGLDDVAAQPGDEVKGFLKHLQIRHAKAVGGARAAA